MQDDFAELESGISKGNGASKGGFKGRKRMREEEGTAREWLRVYETVPAQLLNAYGEARFARLPDSVVWDALCEPLKSGAHFMTEYASPDKERRGIALNRWLKALLDYIEYQEREQVKKTNKFIMKEKVYEEFYDELKRVKPAVVYCLAPKKVSAKVGASSLRSAASSGSVSEGTKSPEELDEHAKTLYEWLDVCRTSRIRMMVMWQAAGGLPFVVSAHHRATQCFRYYGNVKHSGLGREVSLSEFQDSVKDRHRIGSSGIEDGEERDTDLRGIAL